MKASAPTPHPDRFFPADPETRAIARRLFDSVSQLPIHAVGTMAVDLFADSAARAAYDAAKLARLGLVENALADMAGFEALRTSDWPRKIAPIYHADDVVDPEAPRFVDNLDRLGQLADADAYTWKGYLDAHRVRREIFKVYGGRVALLSPPSARAEALDAADATALFRKVCIGKASAGEASTFRALMLVEFARMSADDGLALHIQAGQEGRTGLPSILRPVDYARPLLPLLDAFGSQNRFEIVVLTRDEAAMAHELGPLCRLFPALRFGLAGGASNGVGRMLRYRHAMLDDEVVDCAAPLQAQSASITELAAQNDAARRADCAALAEMVATHRMGEDEAAEQARRWAS